MVFGPTGLQTTVGQEISQDALVTNFVAALNASRNKAIFFNDNGICGADDNFIWDKIKRQAKIVGGTTDPALILSGGRQATYGPEKLTNPAFDSDLSGWICNSGVVWADGEAWLYPGVIATVQRAAGGSGYQVGDILALASTVNIAPANMTTNSLPEPFTVASTLEHPTYPAFKMLGGADVFIDQTTNVATNKPVNIRVGIGTPIVVNQLGFTSGYSGGTPIDCTFWGSNKETTPSLTDDADWVLLHTYIGLPETGAIQSITAPAFTNTTPYKWFRLHITKAHGCGYNGVSMDQLRFYNTGLPGATVRVATLTGSAVNTVTIEDTKYGYVAGTTYGTTGGHGTGCTITVNTVTNATMSQEITVENGAVYRTLVDLGVSSAPIDVSGNPSDMRVGSDNELLEWANAAVGSSFTLTVTSYSATVSNVGKLVSISFKKLIQSPGVIVSVNSHDILNTPNDWNSLIWGNGTAPNSAANRRSVIIGGNSAVDAISVRESVIIGVGTCPNIKNTDCTVVIGYRAGEGILSAAPTAGYQLTIVGALAGITPHNVGNYSVFHGSNAGMGSSASASPSVGMNGYYGFSTGVSHTGDYCLFFGNFAGSNLVIDNCYIVACNGSGTPFLYGIQDTAGTAGYLKLAGSLYPSSDNAYDLGVGGGTPLRWKSLPLSGTFGCNGLAPSGLRTHIIDPSGGSTVDAEARTAINAILDTLEAFGFQAAA